MLTFQQGYAHNHVQGLTGLHVSTSVLSAHTQAYGPMFSRPQCTTQLKEISYIGTHGTAE